MKRRAAQSPACFDVGDKTLYFKDDDEYGTEVIVVQAYGLYSVLDEAGAYLSAQDGKRINYQSGYVVGRKGSERKRHALRGISSATKKAKSMTLKRGK